MTRVDFYLLDDLTVMAGARFACRLALKAVQGGQQVYVHTDSAAQSTQFDDLLWDYPRHRFVPHACVATDQTDQRTTPLLIGHTEPPTDNVLINLGADIPEFFGRFERVAEIVVGERREIGRERYRFYRDCGYPLHHHEMSNWEES